jgi:hypothetical protein
MHWSRIGRLEGVPVLKRALARRVRGAQQVAVEDGELVTMTSAQSNPNAGPDIVKVAAGNNLRRAPIQPWISPQTAQHNSSACPKELAPWRIWNHIRVIRFRGLHLRV